MSSGGFMKTLKLNSKPYYIRKKNLNTITMVVIFPYEYDDKHSYELDLISRIVNNSSAMYPNERDFKKEYLKRMIIGSSFNVHTYYKNLYATFTLKIPNPRLVKNFSLDDAFEFFHDMIYKPNIENNAFNEKCFIRERDFLLNTIAADEKNIYHYSYEQFLKLYDCDGHLIIRNCNDAKLLLQATPSKLYDYYKKIVLNNKPLFFVTADTDKELLLEYIDKYFNASDEIIHINKNYVSFQNPRETVCEVEEIKNYNQSVLYMGYKVLNMRIKDLFYLNTVYAILNNKENNLIFKALRLKKGLVYSSNVGMYDNYGCIYVNCCTNSDSKEAAISTINEVFASLNDRELLETCIDNLKRSIKVKLIRVKDSRTYELDNFIDNKLESGNSLAVELNKLSRIDIDELLKFIKRIKLDTIYFLRGDKNEKD